MHAQALVYENMVDGRCVVITLRIILPHPSAALIPES